MASHNSEREASPGSVHNRPGVNLSECPPLWSAAEDSQLFGRHLTAGLPQTDKLRGSLRPPSSLPLSQEGRPGRYGLFWKPSSSRNHCCSGACLGDGAVVTTTVETALEEPEAVPC